MEKIFDNILDDDEHIVKALKPNKLKFYFGGIFGIALIGMFFLAIALLTMFVPDEGISPLKPIYCLIPISVFILCIIISIIFISLAYNKRYYAYTNKRVIIRCGIIGVDYKSLDMDMIGAIDVNVSLVDKVLNKNTGTITFGSLASPITANGAVFSFSSIVSPYDFYKEIKLVINEKKTQKPE